jgi:hypothetical protein
MASLDMSLVWSLAPLPLAFLVATRLRAPGWLLERNTLRAWLGPVLALALPTTAILVAVPLVRMYEIPWADPGIALEPITAEQRQTAGLYLEAANRMIPIAPPLEAIAAPVPKTSKAPARQPTLDELHALYPRQIEWLKKNEAVLALALQISRRPGQTGLGMAWHGQSADGFYDNVGYLVLLSGRQLESQGKLDAALERYLAVLRMAAQLRGPGWSAIANQFELMVDESLWLWATRPGQTPQRIAAAIQAVAQIAAARKSPREFIESDYRRARAYLAIDPDLVGALATDENTIELVNFYARWLPWERARALRALNVMAAEELEKCRQAEVAGSSSYLLRPSDLGLAPGMEGPANRSPFSVVSVAIISEAYRRGQWTANLLLKVPLSDSQMLVSDWLVVETRCRATQVILALEAWRLEHKALPKSLDELVGPYLQRVPIDPFAREPFRYLPAGLSTPLAWYPQQFAPAQTIAPGKPLLWSTGRLVQVVDRGAKEPRKRYVIASPGQVVSPGTPVKENDVWRAGWAFPIP